MMTGWSLRLALSSTSPPSSSDGSHFLAGDIQVAAGLGNPVHDMAVMEWVRELRCGSWQSSRSGMRRRRGEKKQASEWGQVYQTNRWRRRRREDGRRPAFGHRIGRAR